MSTYEGFLEALLALYKGQTGFLFLTLSHGLILPCVFQKLRPGLSRRVLFAMVFSI